MVLCSRDAAKKAKREIFDYRYFSELGTRLFQASRSWWKLFTLALSRYFFGLKFRAFAPGQDSQDRTGRTGQHREGQTCLGKVGVTSSWDWRGDGPTCRGGVGGYLRLGRGIIFEGVTVSDRFGVTYLIGSVKERLGIRQIWCFVSDRFSIRKVRYQLGSVSRV